MKSLTLAVILSVAATSATQVYVQPRAYQQQPQLYISQPTIQTYQQPQVYQQPQSQQIYKQQLAQNGYRSNGNAYQGNARQSQSGEKDARIVKYETENDGHNYMYSYETENGIRAQEVGAFQGKAKHAQGGYSYTGDDGQVYTVTYTADENGFRPQGAHLPTPPPMPEAIAKAVEQNLQDEANGVVDEGQYTEEQHQQGGQNYQQYQQQPQPKYRQQQQHTPQQQYTYEQPPPKQQYNQQQQYQQQQYQYETQPQQYQVQQYQQYQEDDQQVVHVTPAPYQHQIMSVVAPPRIQQVYQVGPTQGYAKH